MTVVLGNRKAHVAGAAVALLLDRLVGEPPDHLHPVGFFGVQMTRLENVIYRPNRRAGAYYASLGIAGASLGAHLVDAALAIPTPARWSPLSRFCSTLGFGAVCIAGRMLGGLASDISVPLEQGDLDAARADLRNFVGRNPSSLDATAIARAVTESVAENTVDAVIAPAFWAAVCGPAGVAAYRAINTLDAMVGHHSERYEHFGWASARLDDAANWIPARLTAVIVMAVRPRRAGEVWRVVTTDSRAHPSPNSGVAEGAFAAANGVQLGGVNTYGTRVEDRGTLGRGRPADVQAIRDATDLLRHVTWGFAVLLAIVACVLPDAAQHPGAKR